MTHRRSFFAQLGAGLAALAGPGVLGARPTIQRQTNDESWLQGLNGKHRQFFDVNVLNDGAALGRVSNFLDAYRDSYGLRDSDVNVLFGAHGTGLGLVLGHELWSHFDLGKKYNVVDRATGGLARRNLWFETSQGTSVRGLQARGVRFLACRQTIARLARELAADGRGVEADLRAAIEQNLLPGVTAVPAMVVAANRAQEAGLTYVFSD